LGKTIKENLLKLIVRNKRKRILSTGETTPNTWFTNFRFALIYTQYAQGYPQKTGVFALKIVKNSSFFPQKPIIHHCYTQVVDKSCV